MKSLQFNQSISQRLYQDYIKRIKRVTKDLQIEDQKDALMEFNSHIHEHMVNTVDDTVEIERLMAILEKLGPPEDILLSLVVEKTLNRATRTFNPIGIFRGIMYNMAKGISYIIFAGLYLFLFAFVFMILAKMVWPNAVGMFLGDDEFVLGIPSESSKADLTEVLGHWFIPVMILLTLCWYFFITLLFRLKQHLSN